jgi:hypothetical protein
MMSHKNTGIAAVILLLCALSVFIGTKKYQHTSKKGEK